MAPSIHSLSTPENCTIICVDHQPQMTFGVSSIDRQTLVNNVLFVAKAAKIFNVPTILTTVETESFSGYMRPQLLEMFPGKKPIERTSMNSREDAGFIDAVKKTGRKKLVGVTPDSRLELVERSSHQFGVLPRR
jgi:nicotinamidase-related amidase